MATVNTNNYTIGQIDLYFEATIASASLVATSAADLGIGGSFRTAARNLGNIVAAEIAPDVTYIDHYISDKSKRVKDKVVANMVGMTIPFTFDEINYNNLKKYFLASTLSANVSMAVMEQPLTEGTAQLSFNTDVGNDIVYFIPRCTIRPDGNLSISGDDWWTGPMVLEVLHYDTEPWASKPYGFVNASNID